ncbi:TRAP transporter large permease subunit [Vibrio lentus]|nr:TRAP transporter large permease subunit [Vibrio lentus]
MAVPFFIILAGDIKGSGGISQRLVNFANSLVKTSRVVSRLLQSLHMFFAAISGSGPATVAAVGGIKDSSDDHTATTRALQPRLSQQQVRLRHDSTKYPNGDVRRIAAGVSIGDLFIAGIIPGILVSLYLMAWHTSN